MKTDLLLLQIIELTCLITYIPINIIIKIVLIPNCYECLFHFLNSFVVLKYINNF